MKNCAFLVASAVVCASASVFADNVQGANVFGVLTVESTAADTLVAVPWCECSIEDNQAVAISNIVKTANLTAGDTLYALGSDRETVNTWTLDAAGCWVSDKQVTEDGVGNTISVAKAHAARGTAIRLHRQHPFEVVGSTTNAIPFYLFGQVGTQSSFTTPIAAGSAGVPAYTLIAPPNTSDVDVVPLLSVPRNGDSIVTRSDKGVNKEYFYDSGWKSTSRTFPYGVETIVTNNVLSITLSCGMGAWYISRNESAPTLTWTGVPTKTSE